MTENLLGDKIADGKIFHFWDTLLPTNHALRVTKLRQIKE